jgi:hypothetical protein
MLEFARPTFSVVKWIATELRKTYFVSRIGIMTTKYYCTPCALMKTPGLRLIGSIGSNQLFLIEDLFTIFCGWECGHYWDLITS